jgi:type I restriction enzyme M protein
VKNDFCDIADLQNEADVEALVAEPLIKALGYTDEDHNIRRKASIQEFKVGKGSKASLYRPDYILSVGGNPAVVVDAKAPTADLDAWEYQCASYCLELNKAYDYNPVHYFILTNGIKTTLYQWDVKRPLVALDFADLDKAGAKFAELRSVVSRAAVIAHSSSLRAHLDDSVFELRTVSLPELTLKFQRMHQYIWTKEKMSPSAAFEELMKVVFVKIQKDRELHSKLGSDPKPKYSDVVFSTDWVAKQTQNESPINDPLFTNLVKGLEAQVVKKLKKRIFSPSERINLSAETIRWIVKEIENLDFAAMEEDIHGRMFESFLDATVRGRELGQFFTPRDIVDLMVALADLRVSKKDGAETVLDACCGSGGFLIAAMADMVRKADALVGLSNQQREAIRAAIQNESLYGIDAGSNPAIYRIARMNMYLHGDGGSHIYFADALDKKLGHVGRNDLETEDQLTELRSLLLTGGKRFDVILSNPPFSMKYSRDDSYQAGILTQYEIAVDRSRGQLLGSLLSSVMFLERYKDLVAPDGRVLAIIDESVLSGESYAHVREFIRRNFIIVGVVSLPGDAFRRASARVKTSILVLRPRKPKESQPDVFMATATVLGLEDRVARRIGVGRVDLSSKKIKEAARIVQEFQDFSAGQPGPYVVPAANISDRLDVKFCRNDRGRKAATWKKSGYSVTTVGAELALASKRSVKVDPNDIYQFLRVNYDGDVIEGELINGDECSYSTLYVVREWDVLLSNMGVGRGAVGIVPPHHDGKYVSNEYTILTAGSKEEAVYYVNLLRTKEILADILSTTTGMNRGRIKWGNIAGVQVPKYVPGSPEIVALVSELEAFWTAYAAFQTSKRLHVSNVSTALHVDGADAQERWLGFKPPE